MSNRKLPDKETLLALIEFGLTQTQIAEKYGVSHQRVHQIIPGAQPKKYPTVKRFKSFSDKFWYNVAVQRKDLCWDWKAGKNSHGYGVAHKDGKYLAAHRVAYELTHRKTNKTVIHTCGNKLCCNPDHLTIAGHKPNRHKNITNEERFYQYVDKRSKSECWNWLGCKLPSGSGVFSIKRKSVLARNYAYYLAYGYYGKKVRPSCGNKLCCNPDHLYVRDTEN